MAEDVVMLLVESPVGTAQVAGAPVVNVMGDAYDELPEPHTVMTWNW